MTDEVQTTEVTQPTEAAQPAETAQETGTVQADPAAETSVEPAADATEDGDHPAHSLLDELEQLLASAESSVKSAVTAIVARIRGVL